MDNFMIESGAIQDRREREEAAYAEIARKDFERRIYEECDKEEYHLFADPDFLRDLAADLSREDWRRIKMEKGD